MTQEFTFPADLLARARRVLALPEGTLSCRAATAEAGCVAFVALGDGKSRARVLAGRGADAEQAFRAACDAATALAGRIGMQPVRLRAELVDRVEPTTWGALKARLARTKRNYFNLGVSFDARFETALLAPEINGSAVFYDGTVEHAQPNTGNLHLHAKRRFGREIDFPAADDAPVWCFTTRAAYADAEGAWPITPEGQAAGHRVLADWGAPQVRCLVDSASDYLAAQVKPSGEFHYGWFPCFDRPIPTYNTLRHASSTYALLEAWELTRSEAQKAAIDRSLAFVAERLVRRVELPDGTRAAYLLDVGNEIKLGGNAVCLLAFVKYTELTGDRQYLPLLEALALGIRAMQDPASGRFVHVLNHPALDVKSAFRVIYYDGEAAFGLMRLYGLTRDPRWLAVVEKAFEHFIAADHWQAHDHWLSYCVNELTRWRPETRYYEFGLRNVAGYLDFVLERITTFPTLLELMMAAREMLVRLEADPALRTLLDGFDRAKFDRALEHRARYLANGFFWPELAMFFRNPDRVAGSFFIKHHSFRVRIDDVEHYLSGYVAYLKFLQGGEGDAHARAPQQDDIEVARSGSTSGAGAVVAWAGDINLGRRLHHLAPRHGWDAVLGGVPAFAEADLRIANLECVVASCGEQGVKKGEGGPHYYRARPEMLRVLTDARIELVATANNHSGDYGPKALAEQATLLDAAGIGHAGTGATREAAWRPVLRRAGALNVALFSIDATQPRFGAGEATGGHAYLPLAAPSAWSEAFAPRIAAARAQAHVVLVAVHWGANGETVPSADEVAVGHALVEAGADAVLGASGHVLKGVEVYRGRPIVHDAGDFLFDALRSDEGEAGVFSLHLDPTGVRRLVFAPVATGFGRTAQMTGEPARAAARRFVAQSAALGASFAVQPDGRCAIDLQPPPRAARALAPLPCAVLRPEAIRTLQAPREEWLAAEVPAAARFAAPLVLGPLRLLGLRTVPRQLRGRRMLFVESFWQLDGETPIAGDWRLDIRAVAEAPAGMPDWGGAMDHDPCDWMWPTSRWTPGAIYRDFHGLRPPALQKLHDARLHIEVGLVSDAGRVARVRVPCEVAFVLAHAPATGTGAQRDARGPVEVQGAGTWR